MNFIGKMESSQAHVELKYCERCGGLFLRPQGVDLVYCTGCAAQLAAKPEGPAKRHSAVRGGTHRPRMVKGPKLQGRQLQGTAEIEYLQGVATLEVRTC